MILPTRLCFLRESRSLSLPGIPCGGKGGLQRKGTAEAKASEQLTYLLTYVIKGASTPRGETGISG